MRSMKQRMLAAVLCCLMALASAQAALAETVKTATVSGVVVGEEGKGLIAQAVFTGDGFLQRVNTDMLGRFSLKLPLGEYSLELTKGSEYERGVVAFSVPDRKAKYLGALPLKRLYETDWIAGDLHQHSVYSFDGRDAPAEIVLSDLAMGLSFGVLTDHNDLRGNLEFLSAEIGGFLPVAGMEITTERGHFGAIGYNEALDVSVQNGAQDVERIVAAVQKVPGALIQINHPTRAEFPFVDTELTALFDAVEIWNGKRAAPYVRGEPNAEAVRAWYQLLNAGLYLPATAGSDNHDVAGNLLFVSPEGLSDDDRWYMTSMYSGIPRLYVYAPERTAEAVLAAIKAGHSFLTNNPLAFFDIDGAIPGEAARAGDCALHVKLQSNRGLLSYAVVVNGETRIEVSVGGMEAAGTHTLALLPGDWAVLVARGEQGDYAITNPVFIR